MPTADRPETGFDTWTIDNEGYGRSSKHGDIDCDIGNGATTWPQATTKKKLPEFSR